MYLYWPFVIESWWRSKNTSFVSKFHYFVILLFSQCFATRYCFSLLYLEDKSKALVGGGSRAFGVFDRVNGGVMWGKIGFSVGLRK